MGTRRGYTLATGGTENHIVLWNVRSLGLTGSKLEKLLERCNISVNKNAIAGDRSAIAPGGVRLGTPAMTTRGLTEADFDTVASFLSEQWTSRSKFKSRQERNWWIFWQHWTEISAPMCKICASESRPS